MLVQIVGLIGFLPAPVLTGIGRYRRKTSRFAGFRLTGRTIGHCFGCWSSSGLVKRKTGFGNLVLAVPVVGKDVVPKTLAVSMSLRYFQLG